jgi:hypothetical protein
MVRATTAVKQVMGPVEWALLLLLALLWGGSFFFSKMAVGELPPLADESEVGGRRSEVDGKTVRRQDGKTGRESEVGGRGVRKLVSGKFDSGDERPIAND